MNAKITFIRFIKLNVYFSFQCELDVSFFEIDKKKCVPQLECTGDIEPQCICLEYKTIRVK